MRIVTEPMLARARVHNTPQGAVMIDANENPLGPCVSAREAISAIIPQGGRYSDGLTDKLVSEIAQMEGLKPDHVLVYPGSSEPLHHTVCAYTSSSRSYVTADPGYEAGMFAANAAGARVVKVPLSKAYAHDVKAMLAAGPDAGVFYVCTPNNPTGTSNQPLGYRIPGRKQAPGIDRAGGRSVPSLFRWNFGRRPGEGG